MSSAHPTTMCTPARAGTSTTVVRTRPRPGTAKIVSMMMGVWLLASFFGNYLAGYLGSYYQKLGPENFFGIMIVLSLAATALLLLLARGLRHTVRGA